MIQYFEKKLLNIVSKRYTILYSCSEAYNRQGVRLTFYGSLNQNGPQRLIYFNI